MHDVTIKVADNLEPHSVIEAVYRLLKKMKIKYEGISGGDLEDYTVTDFTKGDGFYTVLKVFKK
ncbi:hypothetical protein [Nitrosopumilus sp.]|uniref:hypothetical protein n=1 Tax=Nitrosopumilus sp. TaxID=2024843 RepID=UPI003D13E3E3